MGDVKENQRAYIRQAMAALGVDNPTTLARKADLAPSTLVRFMNQPERVKHQLSAKTLAAIAKVSGLPVPQAALVNDAPAIEALVREAEHAPSAPPRFVGRGNGHQNSDMIPIRGGARGGNEQEMFLNDVIGYTARPSSLKDVKDAYSMYMVGDSMSPRYEPGWLLYVHPHKPPKPGRAVVVEKTNDAVMVKVLRSWKHGKIELISINTQEYPEPIIIDERNVRCVHVIVGSSEEG
ncbi:S24 family peptidase [Azospirillum argentinense]